MNDIKQTVNSGFDGLGIKDTILASIKKLGFEAPTPIQEKTIPTGLAGKDLIGIAQTGTGKTFAFGIPMLQRIGAIGGRGLILEPTRELALQVEDSLKRLGTSLGLKTATFIGGEAQERQLYALRRKPHIIIATPGRLIDFLKRRILTLDDIKVLVLDEADMMFDLGFAPQVEEILSKMPSERQTMLFSATMPLSIVKLTTNHMKMPVSIEAAPSGTTAEKVDQEMYIMHKDDRIKHLEKILNEYQGSVLVFVRTKYSVSALTEQIRKFGHTAEEIHSNLSLRARRRALDDFKSGKARVLVATDIAARGLDVNGIELVINYNLPDKLTDYVHRIGRTGRAGKSGKAISFATPDQAKDIRDIERIINQPIPLTKFAEPQSFTSRSRSSRPSSRAPYKKFDQSPRGTKKSFSDGSKKYPKHVEKDNRVEKDNFERDQRLNHLPKFNNKPDFGTFKFIEDIPTPRSKEARPPKYEGNKASKYKTKPFAKSAYGEKRTFVSEANRTSSYHSGRPAVSRSYDGPSSYKPAESNYKSSKPGLKKPEFKKSESDTWSSHSKPKYGAKKVDGRSARPFRAKSKPGFKKSR